MRARIILLAVAMCQSAWAEEACPKDMKLVERQHPEGVQRNCTERMGPKRCVAYDAPSNRAVGPMKALRFCMDVYEAPNRAGERPIVMASAASAEAWCTVKDKRLCHETEWEGACEGKALKPWTYGYAADGSKCNSGKTWRKFDVNKLYKGGDDGSVELEKLWQGEPSGSRKECVTEEGIYDLLGNVEEWVVSRPHRKFRRTLIGGFWAKPWPGCRGANDAHEPTFRFYETGFRCCRDPK